MKKQLLFIFGLLLTTTLVKAQCTADYTYTISAGTVSVTAAGTPTGSPSGYAWDWGDGTSMPGSGQSTSHTYTASGSYSLCLTYGVFIPPASACTSAAVCKTMIITLVGVNENNNFLKSISLSPNPAKSFVNIDYSLTRSSKLSISLLDLTGKLIDNVETEKELGVGNHSKRYDIENLSAGIYFIRFKTESGTESRKLIID